MANRYSVIDDEKLDEIRNLFEEVDIDKNGHINAKELGQMFDACGEKVPGYQLRDIIAEVDRDKSGTISFDEFLTMYADIKSGTRIKKNLAQREGIVTHSGTSNASSEGTTHSFSEEERHAFSKWINVNLVNDEDCSKILPMDPLSYDLFERIKDGILLCKMINLSCPETIDERAINKTKLNIYTKTENLNLALNSASAIGCNIVNIGSNDLAQGTAHLVLGLLWQIIRIGLFAEIDLVHHPGLMRLLKDGETIEEMMRLSPEELLLRWVNYHLENAGSNRRINNFSGDITDSEAYIVLLSQIAPNELCVDQAALRILDMKNRAEEMLCDADKMKCRAFVTANDVVAGNSKLNMAFVAHLFNMYPALDAPDDGIDDDLLRATEETREEKTFRNWMNSIGVNPYINHLYSDLCDGMVLLQLLDTVKPGIVEWKRVNKPPYKPMWAGPRKLENCNYAIKLATEMRFSLVGVGGTDIADGNPTLTLAVIWQLMRAYTLMLLQQVSGESSAMESTIVEWVNSTLKKAGKSSSITGFQDSEISSSKAVIDLIDSIRPGSINYSIVVDPPETDKDLLMNASYAISMARKIGARVFALPEDLVEVKPKMVMTAFACLMARGLRK